MDNPIKGEADTIATLARAGVGILNVDDGVPFVVVPPDHKIESVERMLPEPARARGTITVDDLDSFIRLCVDSREEADYAPAVYWRATEASASFVCVLNPDTWRDRRIVYTPAQSIEWKRWAGMNGQHKAQVDFATFIEDNAPDVVEPASATMIEVSRSLEAKKKVNFASGIRLSNGQQELTYEETIEGTAAKGKLQIPEVFTIGIPVFVGGDRYKLEARLRYRINAPQLAMWFDLVRPHLVVEDAVKTMVQEIAEKTALNMYRGDPGVIA